MKHLLLVFLLFPLLLLADFDQLFPGEEDPSVCQYVNVITGHLNLSFQDTVVQGAKTLSINRSYSSSGALERAPGDSDLRMQLRRHGWMLMGGWNFFSYTNLVIETGRKHEHFKAYLPEKCGGTVCYSYSQRKGNSKFGFILRPNHSPCRSSGHLSAKTNPKNNAILLNVRGSRVSVGTPDGGVKFFEGAILDDIDGEERMKYVHFYRLVEEVLPNKHRIIYSYDQHTDLVRMELRNPKGNKVFGSIDFRPIRRSGGPFTIEARTSDGKEINYSTYSFDRRHYISQVSSNFRPEETSTYTLGRGEIGARIEYVQLAGRKFLKITYDMQSDKVLTIEAPTDIEGQMSVVAHFTYTPGMTEVCDEQGVITKYFYDSERILKVDYFDKSGHLHSTQKFYWDGCNLQAKALLDASQNPVFAKTFVYDTPGNVVEETLWGNLTGQAAALSINEQGHPTGGESYKKSYSYLPGFNVVQEEREEGGLSYRYFYKPDTDLLICKLTCYQDKILRREYYNYDEDHLLVAEISDDGSSPDQNNLTDVHERHIKQYELDPHSGMPRTISEYGLGNELIRRVKLVYSQEKQVIEEAVYDANDHHRYTLYTSYNSYGQITRKTTSLGQENIYAYDKFGQLIEAKEVGSAKKTYSYNDSGLQTSVRVGAKTSYTTYDTKGRVLTETDSRGNTIAKSYDSFGNCLTMTLPAVQEAKIPFVSFSYDVQGNLTSTTMPLGEVTRTTYNAWRKPVHIIQADGSEIRHFYNKNGSLAKTIEPDGNTVSFQYDPFGRVIAKIADCESEFWTYSPFQMQSYTDPRGLVTNYSYDGAGRKIAVSAQNRVTTFSYDSLGFLEKTSSDASVNVEIHNSEGRVIEEWDNNYENHMYSFYDDENRKIKALRITEKGEATDLFFYDIENQLVQHTDPHQAVTCYYFDETERNANGQYILKKTTVDPLGNSTIEIHDAADRVVAIEKKSKANDIVFREEFYYDLSGNKVRRQSTVFLKGVITKVVRAAWEYDAAGRVIKEIENDQKVTLYSYDPCGRILHKTLPKGITLQHSYDYAGRLVTLSSTDGSIRNRYFYERGPDPVKIVDKQELAISRSYNSFGEIISETSPQMSLSWDYDSAGRPTSFTLPGGSCIRYSYEGFHLSSVERGSYKHCYTKFDTNGHVKEESSIYGASINTGHDLLERPSCQISPWCTHSLAYGPSGLVMAVNNSLFGDKACAYDALNQLVQEGDQTYSFDSLGNLASHTTNEYNQIVSTSDCEIIYDANGNPIERRFPDSSIHYRYDALDRLIEITHPGIRRVSYIYDPLSRLFSKESYVYQNHAWQLDETLFFIYDQDTEIGVLNDKSELLQLKVLGLGLKGDIGAAIAIEIAHTVYAPLHDFMGNVIALVDSTGEIIESYEISAFGKEVVSDTPLNPWRFCSKRFDEDLVFFGKRFYDPELERWLTPDPAGFVDGANLYAYVHNSPLNRLDLFGLWTDDRPGDRMLINMASIPRKQEYREFNWKGSLAGMDADGFAAGDQWYKLQFTPEEFKSGWVNILDHFKELCPSQGSYIGVTTFINGIGNDFTSFENSSRSISKQIDGGFFLGLHTPTEGLFNDMRRNALEQKGFITPAVLKTRQFIALVSENLYKVNRDASMFHICHSNAGVCTKRGLEGLCADHKSIVMRNLLVLALGPSEPVSSNLAASVKNIYSYKDFITKRFARAFVGKSDYDIEFRSCISNSPDRTMHLADHDFLGPTYYQGTKDEINEKKSGGLYSIPKSR